MGNPSTVPIFDPQGTLRDVPYDQMTAAVQAGGKPAVRFQAPDSKIRYVPADQTQDAVKAGGKLLPIEQQDIQHPGFWHGLASDLLGAAKSMITAGPESSSGDEIHADAEYQQKLINEGRSLPYRLLMSLTPASERERAESGDVGGVAASATSQSAMAASPLAIESVSPVANKAITKSTAAIRDAANTAIDAVKKTTPKQAAQVIGGTSGAVAGHGTLSAPGAYYGAKTAGNIVEGVLGKERANSPIISRSPNPVYPGAPLPETPPTEVLQAQGLAQGAQPVVDPAAGLGKLPVHAVQQAITELGTKAPLADITARANQIAQQINDALGGKALQPNVPIKNQGGIITPTRSPSDVAFAKNYPNEEMEPAATPDAVRAWQESAGFKAEPSEDIGAKVRSQMPALPRGTNPAESAPGAEQVKTNVRSAQGLQAGGKTYVPSGGSASELPEPQPRTAAPPRESSAVKEFKYDPSAKEMHITWKGGSSPITYVYGEVTPEQSQMFHAAESKGMAAKSIKDNNVLVAKIVDGKRIPVRPVLSDEDMISQEEWDAGHELETQVEGTPRR